MQISELIRYLESIAPSVYQESYDNSGLLVGDARAEITGVLVCLDSTEAVVEEAVAKNCNLIVAHHPIVFKGLKRLTGKNYVQRVVMEAIRKEVAIYAIHTNLDNVYYQGVNGKIAEKIGLLNTRILAPKSVLKMITLNGVDGRATDLISALSTISSPMINGDQLSVTFPVGVQGKILQVLQQHGIDNQSFWQTSVDNKVEEVGSGMIGELPTPMPTVEFLGHLQRVMKVPCIRHTELVNQKISKVALCGGSGGFLLSQALRNGADIFVTADYKYHEFFDADGKIIIADIGHYESEQFTIDLLYELISQNFTNFAAHCTEVNTNPVQYFI